MKKYYLIISMFSITSLFAQTFSDNFDSYTAGQKLAQQSGGAWTTWSNQPGGSEDVLVSNTNSVSPSNSIYFTSSVQGGGPVDMVKNFGVLNTGSFTINMNMFVETGKSAYFNFQRNTTIGQIWALNGNFNDNGTLTLDDGTNVNLSTTFSQNVWFNFRIDINFNTNVWEVFIDNISKGTFSNAINQIASINLFPVDQNAPYSCGFYVDDFSYTITPYTLTNLNAALTFVSIQGPYLAGEQVAHKVKVRNLGLSAINSFELTSNYNGINNVQQFSGLNIASLAETEVTISNPITLAPGSANLSVTIGNVNGNAQDGDANDNAISRNLDPIVPALGKVVVGEEGTGTWCQWCPRGAVFMDMMEERYGDHWAGIAVHNGDPMTVTEYDDGLGAIIAGYPSSVVDRKEDVDPSLMEPDFLNRIATLPKAIVSNEASYNSTNNELSVKVTAKFIQSTTGNYRIACVLTEDGVTGTGSGYAQSNAYAGGGNGVMGGYESKPNPVPASQMVYDHVARAISTSFTGQTGIIPSTVNVGDEFSNTFTFTLASTWNPDKIHIISFVIDPALDIDNAGKTTFATAQMATNSDITLVCGDAINLDGNLGQNTVPDLSGIVNSMSTCADPTLKITQHPLAGTNLVAGANNVTVLVTDACGNKKVCFKTINLLNAGLLDNSIEKNIQLSPNPANEILYFDILNGQYSNYKITSVEGKLVSENKVLSNHGKIDVSLLKAGIYNIQFENQKGLVNSIRFIKE
jgi:hypothetical protein